MSPTAGPVQLMIQDLPYGHLRALYEKPKDFFKFSVEVQDLIHLISPNIRNLHPDLLPNHVEESIRKIVSLAFKETPGDQQRGIFSMTGRTFSVTLDIEGAASPDKKAKTSVLLEDMEKYTALKKGLEIWAEENSNRVKATKIILKFLGDLSTCQIDLSSLELTSFPPLPQCPGFYLLEVLNLSDNQLEKFPYEELCKLNGLRSLNLSRNELSTFPERGLDFLKQADFSENQISFMPRRVYGFKRLEELILAHNKIATLPQRGLEHLKKGDFSDNKISRFPEEAECLASVVELNFSGNEIQSFPTDLRKLGCVKELDLSGNKITKIPKTIKVPPSLKKLDLSCNEICLTHEEITGLEELEELDFSHNQISAFPTIRSEQLKTLNLTYNPMITTAKEIVALEKMNHLYLFGNEPTPEDRDGSSPKMKRRRAQKSIYPLQGSPSIG